VTPKRIWKRVEKQFEVRTLEITAEGISRHTAFNDTTMRWPMFSAVILRNELYLLVVGKGPGCFMIPKRAFTSQVDETTFRELAERSTRAHDDPEDS
jgi:YcxB-like protein